MTHGKDARISWLKSIFALVALALLSACTTGRDLDQPPVPLGDFSLGHNVVIAPNLTQGPLSRTATQEEWSAAVRQAIEDRFRRYDGDRIYHFGLSVEGYVLAQPGVPLVLQPKSIVIFRLTVWDDASQTKLNAEPQEITVIEAITAESVVGSGLTQTREEQLEGMAVLVAKQIEQFLERQVRDANWFGGPAAINGPSADESRTPSQNAPDGLEAQSVAQDIDGPGIPQDTLEDMLVVEPIEAVTDPEVVLVPPGG